jgi:hypothetical protein
MQGGSQAAHDILSMVKTTSLRVFSPVPLWKVLPDRQFNAATKRFDSLITGLIAQEKARLAAAGNTGTSTATGSDTDTFTDTSGVTGSCLLTQLVQYGAATEPTTSAARISADKGNESSRYALTSKEVLLVLSIQLLLLSLVVLAIQISAASVTSITTSKLQLAHTL